MPRSRRPRLAIHRVDDPAEAATPSDRVFWRVDGRTLRVKVWYTRQWECLPEADRAPGATRLRGLGWRPPRSTQPARSPREAGGSHPGKVER